MLAMICRAPIRIDQMAIRITMKPIVLPGQTRMTMPNSRLTMPRKTRRPTPEVPRCRMASIRSTMPSMMAKRPMMMARTAAVPMGSTMARMPNTIRSAPRTTAQIQAPLATSAYCAEIGLDGRVDIAVLSDRPATRRGQPHPRASSGHRRRTGSRAEQDGYVPVTSGTEEVAAERNPGRSARWPRRPRPAPSVGRGAARRPSSARSAPPTPGRTRPTRRGHRLAEVEDAAQELGGRGEVLQQPDRASAAVGSRQPRTAAAGSG